MAAPLPPAFVVGPAALTALVGAVNNAEVGAARKRIREMLELEAMGAATLADVGNVVLYENQCAQAVGGVAAAPPWFGPAMAAALAPLNAAIAPLNAAIASLNARLQNLSVTAEDDALAPIPTAAGVPPPGVFPASLSDLFQMGGANLGAIEAFYGLGGGGTVSQRRQRIKRFICAKV